MLVSARQQLELTVKYLFRYFVTVNIYTNSNYCVRTKCRFVNILTPDYQKEHYGIHNSEGHKHFP